MPSAVEQEGEVVAGGGQDGVDGIALGMGEIVAAHPVLVFDVADHRFDRRSPSHLTLDGRCHAALLAGGEDPELVAERSVVAAVAGVGEDARDIGADGGFHRGNDRFEGVPVIGIAGKRHGMQRELAALGALQRRRHRHLHPELVGRAGLALADALDLMGVKAVDLAAALALPLLENRRGLVERPAEDRLEFRVADDLAGDVAGYAPEIGLELAQRLAGPLELFGVGVALVNDQHSLADPDIGLAQPEPGRPGQPHQPLAGAMDELGVGGEHDVLRLHSGVDDDPARVLQLHRSGLDRHARLSCKRAPIRSSPMHWRQRVIEERSNGSA